MSQCVTVLELIRKYFCWPSICKVRSLHIRTSWEERGGAMTFVSNQILFQFHTTKKTLSQNRFTFKSIWSERNFLVLLSRSTNCFYEIKIQPLNSSSKHRNSTGNKKHKFVVNNATLSCLLTLLMQRRPWLALIILAFISLTAWFTCNVRLYLYWTLLLNTPFWVTKFTCYFSKSMTSSI